MTPNVIFGIVQKVFSEKASAIAKMRQKCVRNTSKMRQKCVKMGLVLLGKEERPKCVRNPSNLRQKCAEHLWGRTPFGRYRDFSQGKVTFEVTFTGRPEVTSESLLGLLELFGGSGGSRRHGRSQRLIKRHDTPNWKGWRFFAENGIEADPGSTIIRACLASRNLSPSQSFAILL